MRLLEAADRLVARASEHARLQRESFEQLDHRPWPLPRGPWVMGQSWLDLTFLHWALEPEALRGFVPEPLPLDTFDGKAWLGVTPFEVAGARPRGLPPLLRFPEVNVRTYVTVDDRPGIWFFSLDAASRLACEGARRTYRVPYFHADMSIDRRTGGGIGFESHRRTAGAPPAEFMGAYRPLGEPSPAQPGTLDYFLTERYCLYTFDSEGRVLRGEIHHPPWPLQAAEVSIERNTMAAEVGLPLLPGEPLAHYAHRQDVVFWPLAPA